jgi:hypothetical protein
MTYYFHPLAEQELDKAVRYYEECCSGLGLEFAEEIYATIARIIAYPKAWTKLSKHTRRCDSPLASYFKSKALILE